MFLKWGLRKNSMAEDGRGFLLAVMHTSGSKSGHIYKINL